MNLNTDQLSLLEGLRDPLAKVEMRTGTDAQGAIAFTYSLRRWGRNTNTHELLAQLEPGTVGPLIAAGLLQKARGGRPWLGIWYELSSAGQQAIGAPALPDGQQPAPADLAARQQAAQQQERAAVLAARPWAASLLMSIGIPIDQIEIEAPARAGHARIQARYRGATLLLSKNRAIVPDTRPRGTAPYYTQAVAELAHLCSRCQRQYIGTIIHNRADIETFFAAAPTVCENCRGQDQGAGGRGWDGS